MKKQILTLLFFVLPVFAMSASMPSYKDGVYKSTFEKPTPTGYNSNLTVKIQKGAIISVIYDEIDNKGTSKSKDPKIKKLFEDLTKNLQSTQKLPLTITSVPKDTLDNFSKLAEAILTQAQKNHVDKPIIVKGMPK